MLVNVTMMLVDVLVSLKNTATKVIADRRQEAKDLRHKRGARIAHAAMKVKGPGSVESSTRSTLKQLLAIPKFIVSVLNEVLKSVRELLKDLIDALIAILVVYYVVWRLPTKQASALKTGETVGALSTIDWASPEMQRVGKVTAFFGAMEDLGKLLAEEKMIDRLCNFVLVLSYAPYAYSVRLHDV